MSVRSLQAFLLATSLLAMSWLTTTTSRAQDEDDSRQSVHDRAAAVIARREARIATSRPATHTAPYRHQSLDQMMNFGVRGERHYVTRRYADPLHEPSPVIEESELLVDGSEMEATCDAGGQSNCGRGCGGCGHAGCGSGGCCRWLSGGQCELFAGVQGFTGPLNRGGTGSFGIHEGINKTFALSLCDWGLAAQLGARGVHSNFSGAEFSDGANAFLVDDSRNQVFITGGFFRRVDWGLQGGVVVDYLHDSFFYDVDLWQLRGEVSWVYPCHHEIGFWFQSGLNTDRFSESLPLVANAAVANVSGNATATDVYGLFYRYRFDNTWDSDLRLFGGMTSESDGVLGLGLHVPCRQGCALQTGFTYLIPEQGAGRGGQQEESWNVGLTFVWTPWCSRTCEQSYYRPLFNVADNGSFLVDR